MQRNRRKLIHGFSASAVLLGTGFGCVRPAVGAKVVVIGGGFAGATAAKYIRLWSPDIAVTLVEQNQQFVSCPLSNRVLAGSSTMADITLDYRRLGRYGVDCVHRRATGVDAVKRTVSLDNGQVLTYDRLIVAPGIEMDYDAIPGLQDPSSLETVPHAWKAGAQTVLLRKQLEEMKDGGVFAITIPRTPFRCPPGPYERACQVAQYFRAHKPRSKVLVLDANEDIVSKKNLFRKAWQELYAEVIEYHPNNALVDVDVSTRTAILDFDDVKADVLNVVPPQKAGSIATQAGLVTANDRWCEVDFLSYESIAVPNVHILGDAIMAAPQMPKSGHMANQHGKVCAAAVIQLLHEMPPEQSPLITNTCYSFVNDREAMHVAAVYSYDPEAKTMAPVAGAGGVSEEASEAEGAIALSWGRNIWNDVLG